MGARRIRSGRGPGLPRRARRGRAGVAARARLRPGHPRVPARPTHCRAVPGTAYAANPYHYAGNDPVNNVDPLGLRPVTDAELAGEHDSGGGLLSSIGHGLLDVAGLVPVVGEAADLANAAWYTAEGDYTMAALSAAAAIPFAGWGATGAKAVIKGAVRRWTNARTVSEAETSSRRAPGRQRRATGNSSRERGRHRFGRTNRARLDGGSGAASPVAERRRAQGRSNAAQPVPTDRVKEPSSGDPFAQLVRANRRHGDPMGPYHLVDKPVQPPSGLDKPSRVEVLRSANAGGARPMGTDRLRGGHPPGPATAGPRRGGQRSGRGPSTATTGRSR